MEQNEKNIILQENFEGLSLDDLVAPDKDQNMVIKIIDSVEKMMTVYAKKITYSQIRNIYGVVTAPENVVELHRTRPRIAYIQAKQKNEKAKKFVEFLIELIKVVTKDEQIKEFDELMGTIVAYHKLFG